MKIEETPQSGPEIVWKELVGDLWTKRLRSLGQESFENYKSSGGEYGFSEAASPTNDSLADELDSAASKQPHDHPLLTDVEGTTVICMACFVVWQ